MNLIVTDLIRFLTAKLTVPDFNLLNYLPAALIFNQLMTF